MFIVLLLILIILFLISLFSSSKFSPIPYFPSNKKDMPLIIKGLNLKNNQTVVDLGAGDGIVIFEAARTSFQKKMNTFFIAIEINPILVLILHIRRLTNPNRKNIQIIRGDLFKINQYMLSSSNSQNSLTFYLYISPWLIKEVIKVLKKNFRRFSVVSYFYPVKELRATKVLTGIHKVFIY